MCLYPKIIKNKKYTSNKKNGGNIPTMPDDRVQLVPVGCGRCIECKKQKSRAWQVRLLEDIKTNKNGKFTTLTFSDQSIAELATEIKENAKWDIKGYELDNAIATLAVRRFLERWRKQNKKSLRHWLVTELGHEGTENIHLHGIIWTDKEMTEVEKHWKYGMIWKGKWQHGKLINYVNEQTINYSVKYVSKIDEDHKYYNSIVLTSPGIGNNYTKSYNATKNKYSTTETNEAYKTRTGHKMSLPTYWRNKIYTEEEREKLWLQKLDKQERWVCGMKIDISNGEEAYYNALEYHRKRNKELGYGNDEKDWDREQYELERRIIKQHQRIQKGQPTGGQCATRKAARRAGNAPGGAAP